MNSLRAALLRLNSLNRGSYATKLNQRLGFLGNQNKALNLSFGKRFSSSHSNNSEFSRTGLSYTLIGSALCGVLIAVNAVDSPKKEKVRPRVVPVLTSVENVEEQESSEVFSEATTESTIEEVISLESVTIVEVDNPIEVSEPASPVLSEPIVPEPEVLEPVVSEPVVSEPVVSEPVVPEKSTAETEQVISVEIPSQGLDDIFQIEANASDAKLVPEVLVAPTSSDVEES